MKSLSTTRMSSKGQVVIPENVRHNLGLHSGDQFVVIGQEDVIILKLIAEPSLEKFEHLITEARSQAKKAKLKRTDVQNAIKSARKRP